MVILQWTPSWTVCILTPISVMETYMPSKIEVIHIRTNTCLPILVKNTPMYYMKIFTQSHELLLICGDTSMDAAENQHNAAGSAEIRISRGHSLVKLIFKKQSYFLKYCHISHHHFSIRPKKHKPPRNIRDVMQAESAGGRCYHTGNQ